MNEFFTQERLDFFQPLTSKYRAQIVECLVLLYQRLYSASQADYGHALTRDMMIEVFQEALVRAPELSTNTHDPEDTRFQHHREQAGWVLLQLLEHGWLEKQVDSASLQSTYSFSRYGRLFTEPFVGQSALTSHTRHRNTRNTRNALHAFLERGDSYDLLDAFDYSERIISDFSDIISELDERKRDLVREMEDQRLVEHASEAFFDFMEHRFQPDIALRLSVDNVEKHRDVIQQLLTRIRKKDKAFKATAERRLREQMPAFQHSKESVLWFILDGIEQRLRNACEVMLPALRKALQGFTKRADIIIRQLSYLAGQPHNDVIALCQHLSTLSSEQQQQKLCQAGQQLAVPHIALLDPASVKLQAPKAPVIAQLGIDEGQHKISRSAQQALYVQQLLDQAFLMNQSELKTYLKKHLVLGQPLSSRQFPIESVQDFLVVMNAISVAAADQHSSEFRLQVRPESDQDALNTAVVQDYFIAKDHFIFELVEAADVNRS